MIIQPSQRRKSLTALNQFGFDHVIVILLFVIAFALAGTTLLVLSHAQSWSGELQLGLDRGLCLDNRGGSRASGNTIDLYTCTGSTAQKWTVNELTGRTDRFTLENDQGTCADDWGDKVSTGSTRVYLKTYSCNSSDPAQQWEWEGSTLENVSSLGCINDPSSSRTSGTPLIVYSCSGRPSNELWYEASQPAQASSSSSSTSSSSSGTGSGTSGSGTATALNQARNSYNGHTTAYNSSICTTIRNWSMTQAAQAAFPNCYNQGAEPNTAFCKAKVETAYTYEADHNTAGVQNIKSTYAYCF